MAKKLTDEVLQMDIVLNGNEAQKQMGKLQAAQKDLKSSNEALRKEKAKLISEGKKESEAYKNITSELSKNNKAIRANSAQQTELRKKIGLSALTTRQLAQEQRRLKAIMSSFTPGSTEWNKYNSQLQKVNTRLRDVRAQMRGTSSAMGAQKQSLLSNAAGYLGMATGIGAAVEAGRRIITFAKDFVSEGIKMADEARGVEFAFKALGEEGEKAFAKVKRATRGTLSNLDIKKALVNFGNFDIPIDKADVFFEFLTVRATQTGEDITKLQDSLVEGLSKESKLRIDNLGISQAALNKELEKTPDFMQAVANIAKVEVSKAGDILDKAASGTARWNAATQNLQLNAGKFFGTSASGTTIIGKLSEYVDKLADGFNLMTSGLGVLKVGFSELFSTVNGLTEKLPFLNKVFSTLTSFFKVSPTAVLGRGLVQLGGLFAGLGAVINGAKENIKNFFNAISQLSRLKLDFSSTTGFFKSIKNLDITGVLGDIKKQFSEGGTNLAEAYTEAYDAAIKKGFEKTKKENETTSASGGTKELTPEQKAAIEAAKKAEVQRLDALKQIEEEYETERENRLANNNEKRARLDLERALEKANALKAEQELLDIIRAEHQIKINEAIAQDQELELERMRQFEQRKRDLENELFIQKTESDQEKEELRAIFQAEKDAERLEQELAQLEIDEAQKAELRALLIEQQEATIDDIKEKWRQKDIEGQIRVIEARKAAMQQGLQAFANAVGAETKIGRGALLIKQLLAAKEMAINLGLFKAKTSLNVAEASSDIAKGTAKSASAAPFPANIPLILGFLASVAGIISTIRNIGQASNQIKTQGFQDGLYPDQGNRINVTRTDGKKFNAAYGGGTKTGMVTQPTYFRDYIAGEAGPELIVDASTFKRLDPRVVDYIYNVRGYQTGLYQNQSTQPTPAQATLPIADPTDREERMQLMQAIQLLNARLQEPLMAKTYIGYREAADIKDLQEETQQSNQNGTLAS